MIEKSFIETNPGLLVSSDLKWATQVEKASKPVTAAKPIIAQIRNSFSYFDAELVRQLYVLEFAAAFRVCGFSMMELIYEKRH